MRLMHKVMELVGLKETAKEVKSLVYQKAQKPPLFSGEITTYAPYAVEEGKAATVPPKQTELQAKYEDLLNELRTAYEPMVDVKYQVDIGNQSAKSDLLIGGKVIKDVPVTTLMGLLHMLEDMQLIVEKMPTPSSEISWKHDSNLGQLVSATDVVTQRTEKLPQSITMSPPTDKHPAQTHVYNRDVPIGEYTRRIFSGAIPADKKRELLARISADLVAVSTARDTANLQEVKGNETIANLIFDHVYGALKTATTP